METLTPLTMIQPEVAEVTPDEHSVALHPLARGIINTAINLATDFAYEVLEPELPQQRQVQRSARNQEELRTALDIAMAQTELDILEAQSPHRVLNRFFDVEQQTRDDATNIAAVRAELSQIAAQPASGE